MGRIHVGVTVPRGVNGSGWIRSGSQFRVPRPYYLSRAPNAPTAFVLRSEEFPSRSHFPRRVSSLWSFPRGEQTLMEPSNLSALKEEEEEEDETSVGGGDQVRRAAPSAFSPDSIPPRPASQSSLQKYAPLEWSDYFDKEDDVKVPGSDNVFHVYMAGSEGPVVFCIHGGGYSGLSFSLAASKIKEKARVLSMDLRGHGKSVTDNDLDLSIETLCNDILSVLKTLYGDSPPAVILVGHSMGGSVAVHVAARKVIRNLAGLVVIDVVEGTAMASLVHMQKILSSRMQYFPTIEKAIEWSVKGGPLRNIESSRVSVPSTLVYDDSKKCYTYRTPLEKTERYWKGWYEGLSEMFLSCPVPKLLLLAGTDRLDRSLTIGQMQGKFQMVVVRYTGHAIQEDVPDEFASLIINFISRNRIGPNGVEVSNSYSRVNPTTTGRRRRNNFSGPAAAAIAVIRDPQEGRSLDRASELDRASSLSTVIADEQLEAPPDRSQRPGDCDMCNVRDGSSLRASPEHRSRTQDRIGWGGGCGGQEGNIEWWRESS
ncbi:hypothetical protein C4D60_Mb03t19870 [Musa balbisiana]|uniref:protein phosphatase methylesterase-1 n=1 Tax=Musa balbisiana TaxID=52838 RepID=A0A4S8JC86_MUSBA|nr:hypothetical protein C4D60_Mb03t19870 [Musa balbisiana]